MVEASPNGLRILLVEDEFFVALAMEQMLSSLGHHVVGPAKDVDSALDLARKERLDGAVLDVNLRGRPVFPVAELLAARGIGFVFATGYTAEDLPEAFRDYPRLRKPFSANNLVAALSQLAAIPKGVGTAP